MNTNLYISFEKIKDRKPPLRYVRWEGLANDMDLRGLNTSIKKSIDFILKNALKAETDYIALTGEEKIHIEKGWGPDNGLRIYHYDGYQYLFLFSHPYAIFINYASEGMAYSMVAVECHKWNYIKDIGMLYRTLQNTDFIVINTFDAFLEYAKCNNYELLNKSINKPFFDGVVDGLRNSGCIPGTRILFPEQITITVENEYATEVFTVILFDYYIIVTDYKQSSKAAVTPV